MKTSHFFRVPNALFAAKVASRLLFATLAASSSALAAPAATATKDMIAWRTDLPTALADAAKQNKTVLLRFTAKWCGPCRVMDARVWPDPTVQAALARKYVIVKSDVDEEASQVLAQKYGIPGVPTLLLLDGKGRETARGGFMSSPEMVKFLDTSGATPTQP